MIARPRDVPTPLRATYRVQLRPELGLDAAAALAPYLAELGISHLYASPYLQAAAGSTHGYDVVDPTRVNEELGGEAAHARLHAALAAHGLGQVLDIVPNHMSIAERGNAWWWDVLENGPSSRYAAYFDVDWDPPQARLRNTVLLPVLGDHYGRVLEAGELALERRGGGFEIRYHDHCWPVAPRSLDELLAAAAAHGERAGAGAPPAGWAELAFLAEAFGDLPLSTATDRESTARRHRDKEVLRGALARLLGEQPAIAAAVDAEVARVNADPDLLDALLERQNYRPAFWRTAGRELDYRRFFDVAALAALRSEDERVFADVHARVLGWVAQGILDGLRIDHPDGLYDPAGYFGRLRAAAPAAWIVIEKILAAGERLPEEWPVAGTTGYDFLNRVHRLFVDPRGEEPLTRVYQEFLGEERPPDWPEISRRGRLLVMDELLAADLERVTQRLRDVCERHRRHRDYTRHELRQALRETAASLPVYRTYVRASGTGGGAVSAADRAVVGAAIAAARCRRPDLPPDLFELLERLLLLELELEPPGEAEGDFAMRFQQLSAPVMAKGVEDTAFYRFNRLVSLNEVGGDPDVFALAPEAFHRSCIETQERFPRTMLATSTHDTKRSEDVRARLALLSEIPQRWAAAAARWSATNARWKRGGFPDRDAEYLLYQTLVGAWPLPPERAALYMEKAVREAKRHTAWTRPDAGYETAVRDFVHATLADPAFTDDLAAFVAPLVAPGRVNALAQTLVKLTAPGVPDLYQGSELWDLSLVDPDNRRPVDYELRRRLLGDLVRLAAAPDAAAAILARADEGLPKLWTIRQALGLRRRRPALFSSDSPYRPLAARGGRAAHALAFARGDGGDAGAAAIVVVPRLVIGLGDDWGDTVLDLPAGRFRDELSGGETAGGERRVAELLARFPVALLAPLPLTG